MMSPLWIPVWLTCHPSPLKFSNPKCLPYVLKVITLFDITDGVGNIILPCSLQGIRCSDWRSSYTWPHSMRPLPEVWRTWCKIIYIQFYIAITSNRLQRPPEIWQQYRPLIQKWFYFANLSSNHLFQGLEATRTFMHFLPAHSPKVFHSSAIIAFLATIPSSSGQSDFTMHQAHSKTSTLS